VVALYNAYFLVCRRSEVRGTAPWSAP